MNNSEKHMGNSRRNIHGISPLVDIALAEMNEHEEWLELNRSSAPPHQVHQANQNLLTAIHRLNAALDNHSNQQNQK